MAINRISAPSASPASVADYSAIVAQLAALVLDKEQPARVSGSNVLKGAFFNIGGVLYVADANTAISGTASDYVKITPSGATAAASFVASLSGVTYNSTYKGMYDGSGNLYILAWNITHSEKCNLYSWTMALSYIALTSKMYFSKCGTVRVVFEMGHAGATGYGKIYKNGVAAGTERSTTSYSSWTEDIEVLAGDYLEIWGYTTNGAVATTINWFTAALGNN